jgi:hypothetical protein
MPQLIRMYIRQVLIGFGLSALFVGALLYTDVAGLWGLVSNSDMGFVAVLMLFMFNGIVFAGVQFSIAIMRMQDHTPGGGRRAPRTAPQPVPVMAEAVAPKAASLNRFAPRR